MYHAAAARRGGTKRSMCPGRHSVGAAFGGTRIMEFWKLAVGDANKLASTET